MKKRIWFIPALSAGAALAARALRRGGERYSFSDKVVLITGGSRGLGLVLARQLAEEGARLAIVARDAGELARAREELAGLGAEVFAFECDVSDRQQAEDAIDRVIALFGRIDVLINNAGTIATGPLEHMRIEDFQDEMALHGYGPLYLTMAAVPHMRAQGGGRVVNISSIGGAVSIPHLVPYCMSKFALTGLSDGLRAELRRHNILVTTVRPGLMRTGSPFNALFKGKHKTEFTLFTILASMPLITIDARRAARQIIEACRDGDPQLTITLVARGLEIANILFPDLLARVMALTTRLLPGPTDAGGDVALLGSASSTRLAPSPLTHLQNEAALRNNEVGGQTSLS